MTEQDLRNEIIDVIAESTETELDVTPDMDLFADMGLSSMEIMVMLGDLEDAFDIEIPVEELTDVCTVQDLSDIIMNQLRE